jgi:hypothetical protein
MRDKLSEVFGFGLGLIERHELIYARATNLRGFAVVE